MYHRFSDLTGMDIEASDGRMGEVHDLLFDDRFWTLRYLVVDTGGLLSGRKVLIPPTAIDGVDRSQEHVAVRLNFAQVKESPGIDLDPPVSLQKEAELQSHSHWPWYWDAHPAGLGIDPMLHPLPDTESTDDAAARRTDGDPHLRSSREVKGYRIGALDGEIGQVHDMLFDADDWVLRYFVVDTRVWLPGRKVIVSPYWAEAVDWEERELLVDLSKEQIKSSPEYDPDGAVERDYEEQLHRHYQREGYWAHDRAAARATRGSHS